MFFWNSLALSMTQWMLAICAVNTAFPALIPTFAGMATGASKLSLVSKIGIGLGLASNPLVQISGFTILGVGALVGALMGGTYSLIRTINKNQIVKEENKTLTK